MDLAGMLGSLRDEVQDLFPDLHGHQVKTLSEAVLAMIAVGHSQLSRMALVDFGTATVPSGERRFQRLVANVRLNMPELVEVWSGAVLADPSQMTLILDETPKHNDLRAMKLCRQVRGRAVPVIWSCYKPDALPMPQDALVLDLLQRAAEAMSANSEPTLLADRGLSWPEVLDFCVEHHWHYVLRVQSQTRVKLDDGRVLSIGELVPKCGNTWRGQGCVFKKAGWRRTNIVAYWAGTAKEPWLLISDLPPSRLRCQQYRKRMRVEESFRDEKSHGFQWQQSRIRDPSHAMRLLLVMALAMRYLIRLGQYLIRSGQRTKFERQDRRNLSVFQLGLRSVLHCCHRARPPPPAKSVG